MRYQLFSLPSIILGLCLILGSLFVPAAPASFAAPMPALTQTAEPPTSTATSVPSATATNVPTSTATSAPSATATNVPTSTATSAPSATATSAPTDVPAEPGFADPAVTKQADVREAAVGDLVTFTLTVTNNGNRTARGVVVEDSLPAFLGFVSAEADRGQIVQSGTTIGFWIGDVAPGEVLRCTIVTRVLAGAAPPNNRNTVRLSTTSGSDNISNNTDLVEVIISPESAPTITPEPSATTPSLGVIPSPAPSAAQPASSAPPVPPAAPAPAQLPATSSSAGAPMLPLLVVGSLLVVGGIALRQRDRRPGR